MLPVETAELYDALHEPASAPSSASSGLFAGLSGARRANSLPKRPHSAHTHKSPQEKVPDVYGNDGRRVCSAHDVDAVEEEYLCALHRKQSFRHVLFQAKTHVFALTAKDGSRQYVYSRPLAKDLAIVLVAKVGYTPVYVSALEFAAARYALLVDEGASPEPVGMRARFREAELMRCPPKVAKLLVNGVADWLKAGNVGGGQGRCTEGLLRRTRSWLIRSMQEQEQQHPLQHHVTEEDVLWWASSATSSGLSAEHDPRDELVVQDSEQAHELVKMFVNDESGLDPVAATAGKNALPWESVSEHEHVAPNVVKRVLELGDATLLFRCLSTKVIIAVLVALLEERRVCIIGQDTALVSRAVLAFDNLLRPFEWPHLLSPILLEHMLPVLGAPFPFLVGILGCHVQQTLDLPMDEVVFVDLESGKLTTTHDIGDLYKRVPRRIRTKFERRLARTKSACSRQVHRSMSSPYVPTVSNTATSYFEDDPFQLTLGRPKPMGSLLWRSRSQLRLLNDASPQNIWMQHETVKGLDKCMRKFYSELLDDLPALKNESESPDTPSTNESTIPFKFSNPTTPSMSFTTTKRDTERRLARAFVNTQMFMQWDETEGRDATFGIVQTETSTLKTRTSIRDFLQRVADDDDDDYDDGSKMDGEQIQAAKANVDHTEYTGMGKCTDKLGVDENGGFTEDRAEKKSLRVKARRNRKRKNSRLQFNSEVEEFAADPRTMLSDVEGACWTADDMADIGRDRNLSTECNADADVEQSKWPWMTLRLPPASRWKTGRELSTFFSSSSKADSRVDYYSDRPSADVSDADDERWCGSDEELDNRDRLSSSARVSSEGMVFVKPRIRAWGRRRVRTSLRVH